MISFFLDPYPEEIIYSVIARNAAALNYPNLRSVGITYFGNPHTIATVAFPCRLEYLVTHLPPGAIHHADTLIDKHTLLPFFAPFLPPTRVTQLRDDMRGTHGMGVHMRAGTMASTIPMPGNLQFCSMCVKEDREQYGESFWHRQHQISGVHVCTKHNIWLKASLVRLADRQTRHEYIPEESALAFLPPSQPLLKTSIDDTLLTIARSTEWLLEEALIPKGLEHFQEQYARKLVKLDLATYTGRIRMCELAEAFLTFYSKETLAFLHCNLDTQSQDNWLARLVRKPDSALHPLHHILLMNFFGGDIADYLSTSSMPQTPFGRGPWPCLNPVCTYYQNNVIKTCTITYPTGLNGQPSGKFACSCGFIYGRVGPDKEAGSMHRRGKIITVGNLWENKLQQYWIDDALSLREIARRLGVDPLTVKRHAQRLSLDITPTKKYKELIVTSQGTPNAEHLSKDVYTQRDCTRAIWQEACTTYGHCGRKVVRQQVTKIYIWLYRHDHSWLEQHLPPRKSHTPPQRIDWPARDQEISQLIPEAIQQLQMQPGPPRRVTIAAVGRAIGYLAMIQQHLKYLPLTADALTEAEESRIKFAIRRIKYVAARAGEQGQTLKPWELVRLCGLARLLPEKSIQQALDNALLMD